MIEYLVEIKLTEVYHVPISATSESEAIDIAYEYLDVAHKEPYWVDSESESNVL